MTVPTTDGVMPEPVKPIARRQQSGAFAASPIWALPSLPVGLVFLACLGFLVVISFFGSSVYALYVPGFSLANYVKALTSSLYYNSILASLLYSVIATPIAALLAYPMAFYICRHAGGLKGFYIALVVSVFLVTFVVKIFAWQILLQQTGLISQTLVALGLVSEPIRLVGTPAGVILGLIYAPLPYMILAMIASIDGLPRDLEAAAAANGANRVRVFLTVILPLSMPGVVTAILFGFALNVAAFIVPSLLGAGKINMTGLVIQRVSVGLGSAGGNWPLAAALSVILLVVSLVVSALIVRPFSGRRWRL